MGVLVLLLVNGHRKSFTPVSLINTGVNDLGRSFTSFDTSTPVAPSIQALPLITVNNREKQKN